MGDPTVVQILDTRYNLVEEESTCGLWQPIHLQIQLQVENEIEEFSFLAQLGNQEEALVLFLTIFYHEIFASILEMEHVRVL